MEATTTADLRLPPVSARSMQPADIDRVLAIAAQLPTAPHWPRQAYLRTIALSDPSAPARQVDLVAEAEGVILGFLLVSLIPPEAEVESIAVALEAQRRGIGGLLLETAIMAARSAQIERLFLETRASNHAAASLYRRAGFRETGRRPHYYSAPEEDAILMQLNPIERL